MYSSSLSMTVLLSDLLSMVHYQHHGLYYKARTPCMHTLEFIKIGKHNMHVLRDLPNLPSHVFLLPLLSNEPLSHVHHTPTNSYWFPL